MSMSEFREQRPSGADSEGWRTPGERDLDRILYASAYRRLGGVTQVLPAGEQPLMHNRLTHTLKVQQVARREAQYLLHDSNPDHIEKGGGLDPAVAEAAGAAHDLGHPPFGHVAEAELQRILDEQKLVDGEPILEDSFEGNAQSFRIVTKLSVRKQGDQPAVVDRLGLDLTYATQAAILKYPWCKGEHGERNTPQSAEEYYKKKWGAYTTEREAKDRALRIVPTEQMRSLEAEVMDYADDVTYAVHDIEDFFRVGLIPLHEMAAEGVRDSDADRPRDRPGPAFSSFWSFAQAEIETKGEIDFQPDVAREMFRRVADLFPTRPFQDTERDRLALHKFISATVSVLQKGTTITAAGTFHVPDDTRMLIEVLKQLTWYYVIEHPTLAALQIGQRKVVSELVTWCDDWAQDFDPEKAADDATKRAKIRRRRERELPGRLLSYLGAGQADKINFEKQPSEAAIRLRAVVDYVASLTEDEAYSLHRRLGGTDASGTVPLGFIR